MQFGISFFSQTLPLKVLYNLKYIAKFTFNVTFKGIKSIY